MHFLCFKQIVPGTVRASKDVWASLCDFTKGQTKHETLKILLLELCQRRCVCGLLLPPSGKAANHLAVVPNTRNAILNTQTIKRMNYIYCANTQYVWLTQLCCTQCVMIKPCLCDDDCLCDDKTCTSSVLLRFLPYSGVVLWEFHVAYVSGFPFFFCITAAIICLYSLLSLFILCPVCRRYTGRYFMFTYVWQKLSWLSTSCCNYSEEGDPSRFGNSYRPGYKQ